MSGALVFDLGKVLVDFSVEKACMQIARTAGVAPDLIKSFLFDDGLELRFEAGEMNFAELHQIFERQFSVKIPPADLMQAASNIFSPIDQNLKLLARLREKYGQQTRFVLLSNTNEIHWAHIEKQWNLSQWFHHLILSFEVKATKPHERIYLEVERLTGLPLSSCFFVDDVAANVDGARRTGLDAELYTDTETLCLDLLKRGYGV
jgi:putative hydrolase of the HAD superfamily